MSDRCPGLYCGRIIFDSNNTSECGACPRGFRTNSSHCLPCSDHPEFYDWLYLTFIVLLTLVLHWTSIDCIAIQKDINFNKEVLAIHLSAIVEVFVAAIATILILEPTGSFQIKSCKTVYLSDWYTLFHNPTPNYETTLYCTQEAVYPLYSMVFIFYAIAAVLMILFRPKCYSISKISIYAGLYFYPALALFQAVFGGIVYFTFPYIIIVGSLISCAIHLSSKADQTVTGLIVDTIVDSRNLVIMTAHWLIHAYGIVAITELKESRFHWSMLALVPLPTVFYILTVKFTDPNKIDAD